MVSVGTIVWLSSELMFFAALFAMYFTLRSVEGQAVWDTVQRPTSTSAFATLNTTRAGALLGHLPDRRVRRRAR